MAATGLALLGLDFVFGSFVLVPCMASTTAVMFAGHLQGRARARPWPWGSWSSWGRWRSRSWARWRRPSSSPWTRSTSCARGPLPAATTKALLVLSTVAALIMPGVLAGRLRDRLAQAERRLSVMAWHLERLGRQA